MIVVDASIAVKWLVEEPDSDRAAQFLEKYRGQLIAPDLMLIEVAGALVRRSNSDQAFASDAFEAVETWASVWTTATVHSEPVTPARVLRAAEIALQLVHPIKDCLYLALAVELGAELATCDARFRDRVGSRYSNVKLLSNYVQ